MSTGPAVERLPRSVPPWRRGLLTQATTYAAIGASNFALTLLVLNALVYFGQIDGGPALLGANVLAVAIAIVNSYVWNSLFTFQSGELRDGRLFVRFMLVNIVGFVLNQAVFASLAYPLLAGTDLHRNTVSTFAQGVAQVLQFTSNFVLLRFWAYRVAPGGGLRRPHREADERA